MAGKKRRSRSTPRTAPKASTPAAAKGRAKGTAKAAPKATQKATPKVQAKAPAKAPPKRAAKAKAAAPTAKARVKQANAARAASRRAADVAAREELVIDAVLPPDHAEPQPTFESLTQQIRSWVLLDEGFSTSRGEERIDAVALARLRAHVLLMRHGRFAAGNEFGSMPEDAESLVHEHLRAWIASLRGTEVARVVLCAHDAFASEEEILRRARHQAGWWLANGVYPIHVIWESGFEETLVQLVDAARERALGPTLGRTTSIEGGVDPVIEGAVRVLGGPTLWAGAKRGAERAFDADGAGRRLLGLLKEEFERATRPVELHLVGFGAGSSFQAQVVRSLAAMRMASARTLAFLAPTLSIPEFRASVAPFAGFAVRRMALFTLARDLERADRCGPYRKSFLSLLRSSLEEDPGTEILGLEESLRRSPDVARLFGLGGATGAPGEALFAGIAPGITDATVRADFEDDVATMNSVVRRVLDQPLGGIIAYQSLGGGSVEDGFQRRLTSEFDRRGIDWAWMRARLLEPSAPEANSAAAASTSTADATAPEASPFAETPSDPTPVEVEPNAGEPSLAVADAMDLAEAEPSNDDAPLSPTATLVDVVVPIATEPAESLEREIGHVLRASAPRGRRLALSIGIDRYAGRPLNGATADALLWNETFARLGFVTREPLLDAQATRAEILASLRSMLGEARDGDLVAIHFSGYGASVGDAWSEESTDAVAMSFEALVPFDVDGGAFVLGGDIADVLRDASEGVHVAFFLDCSFIDGTSRIYSAHLSNGGTGAGSELLGRDANANADGAQGDDGDGSGWGSGDRDTDIEPLRRTFAVSDAIAAKHVAFRRRIGQLLRPGAGWENLREGASALFFLASGNAMSAWERDGYGAFSLAATRVLRTAHAGGRLASLTNESFIDAVRDVIDESQRPELHCLGAVRHAELFASAIEQVVVSG